MRATAVLSLVAITLASGDARAQQANSNDARLTVGVADPPGRGPHTVTTCPGYAGPSTVIQIRSQSPTAADLIREDEIAELPGRRCSVRTAEARTGLLVDGDASRRVGAGGLVEFREERPGLRGFSAEPCEDVLLDDPVHRARSSGILRGAHPGSPAVRARLPWALRAGRGMGCSDG